MLCRVFSITEERATLVAFIQDRLRSVANLHRNFEAGNGRISKNGRNDINLSNSVI